MIGVIPIHSKSKRFPYKFTRLILGKPLVWHVYQVVSKVMPCHVATDYDRVILSTLEFYNIPHVIVGGPCYNGTERVFKSLMGLPGDDIIMNIQGDEPLLTVGALESLADGFEKGIRTLTTDLISGEEFDTNTVKVIKKESDHEREALGFFRSVPVLTKRTNFNLDYKKHIGVYLYDYQTLEEIVDLDPTPAETELKLEQLRWMANGYRIDLVHTNCNCVGVNVPSDLVAVERLLIERNL